MQTTGIASISTWHIDPAAENSMGASHAPLWRHLISLLPERDLTRLSILDFGCNQGGFLRTLYATRPFRQALGVDIAASSVARANELKGDLPIQYQVADELVSWDSEFDIAFAYEVLYLLPDLAEHATLMRRLLKPGGVYYPVIGCHTDSPLWPRWRSYIAQRTNAVVQDYSLNDIADAFRMAGFSVAARKTMYDGFVPLRPKDGYYENATEALDYFTEVKVIFRLAAPLGNPDLADKRASERVL